MNFDLDPVVFLGTADGAIQDAETTADSIRLELALFTILGYRTAFGAPFLWQSSATLNAFSDSRALFELPSGPIISGRPETSTVGEYFYQRQYDTQGSLGLILAPNSPFRAERPGAIPVSWERQIGPATKIEPRPGSVESHFKNFFLRDTTIDAGEESIHDIALVAHGGTFSKISRSSAENLLLNASESVFSKHFSRASVEDTFRRNATSFAALPNVLNRTSALYQAANGMAHSRVLFTTPRIARELKGTAELVIITRRSVSPMNPYLFMDLLQQFGVQPSNWLNVDALVVAAVANTHNPLKMFAELYKSFLYSKLFEWLANRRAVTYYEAVHYLRYALLRDNTWKFLEPLTPFSKRSFDSLVAGVVGGATGAALGINPFTTAGATRQIVEFGYKFLDGLSLTEILSMRRMLRRYIRDIGLAQ